MNRRATLRPSLVALIAISAAIPARSVLVAQEKEGANAATACLRRTEIRSTKVLDARNVLVTTRDRSTYRSELAKQCPGLRRGSTMALTYSDNKLCAGSLFTVMMRAGASSNATSVAAPGSNTPIAIQGPGLMPGAVCQLGVFTPINADEIDALLAATDSEQRSRRRTDRDAIKTEAVQRAPPSSP